MSTAAAGATIVAKGQGANVRSAPSRSSPVLYVAKPGAKATSTGLQKTVDGKGWIQVRPYHAPNGPRGWVTEATVTVQAPTSTPDAETQARAALELLVASDKKLYKNGIETLALLVKLQRKGVNVTKQKAEFARIARAFLERQARIRAKVPANALKATETEGSRAMLAYVRELGLAGDIGVLPIVAIIIIAVVIGLAVTGIAALLGFFEEEYGDSVKNLKESEELKKALATLSPEDAAVVRNDLEQQIDKGYGQGRKDEAKEGWFSDIKNLALLAAGGFVVMKLMDTKKAA